MILLVLEPAEMIIGLGFHLINIEQAHLKYR